MIETKIIIHWNTHKSAGEMQHDLDNLTAYLEHYRKNDDLGFIVKTKIINGR